MRKQWLEKFSKVRQRMEILCEPLSLEERVIASTDETSPAKWHLAHTTWFFDFFILRQWASDLSHFPPQPPTYDYLFNSYYESLGAFLPKKDRRLLSHPSSEEIALYRSTTNQRILALIEKCGEARLSELTRLLELGLNHEQQHQELLLMDIKQNRFLNPLRPAYPTVSSVVGSREAPVSRWMNFAGGKTEIGTEDPDLFHYDNEGGHHSVWLEPFSLASHLVTNGEYLEFIAAGGYEDAHYWLSDGWEHLKKSQWTAPLYWVKENHRWNQMHLDGLKPLNLSEPVSHLSYYEAQAFASFRGARLPTEFEFEHVALQQKPRGSFQDEGRYHPVVSAAEPFSDLEGELWQWTQSAYLPYPRFKPFGDSLMEYNSKFMCNQMVLRGGSCVTPKDHYRSTYRNFFYPHQRWQFTGLRLAKDNV